MITAPVERLRDALGLPGMLVIQFGLDPDDPHSPHRLSNHAARPRRLHRHPRPGHRARLAGVAARVSSGRSSTPRSPGSGFTDRREPWWGLIRLAFSSPAQIAMIQAQDVLGLGSEARMNAPGSAGGSWRWQMRTAR